MKTLGKLNINSEKMLKNEELVNLKGGYTSSPAKDACVGKGDNESCSYSSGGTTHSGNCKNIPLAGFLCWS